MIFLNVCMVVIMFSGFAFLLYFLIWLAGVGR